MHYVVIDDLEKEYWEGALIDVQNAHRLRHDGVCLLPINSSLLRYNGAAGYTKKAWGSGWVPQGPIPRPICPVALYVVPEHSVISWAARLVPAGDEPPNGQLRLITDTSQRAVSTGGLMATEATAVDLNKLGPPDANGGWTVTGSALLNTVGEQYYGFALFGTVRGVAVVWFAVSQASHK